jgi:hypothetical protein
VGMTFRHKVNIKPRTSKELVEVVYPWVKLNIGKRYDTWDRIGNIHNLRNGNFRFRFKKDATYFALRWL